MPKSKDQPENFHREGLTFLHEPPRARVDLVIVHGLNGSPYRTFHNEETGFYWPNDIHRFIPQARIAVFGYIADVSSGSSNSQGVYQHAESLLLHLKNHRLGPLASRPLVFVGHSLGGLVIKQALVISSRRKVDEDCLLSTRAVFFLGTPHRGSHVLDKALPQLGIKIGKIANREVPANVKSILQPRASESFVANSDFMRIKGQISIVNFYEQILLPGLGDLVVDKDSAVFDSELAENVPIARDHRTIARFDGPEDDAYRALYETLCRKINTFLQEIEEARDREAISKRKQECLESLVDPCLPSPLDRCDEPHGTTLGWLWDSKSDYSQWFTNGSGLFCVSGKPGSGKSVLLNAVTTRARKDVDSHSLVIHHFFNQRGQPLDYSLEGFLRSILIQALQQEPSMSRFIADEWLVAREVHFCGDPDCIAERAAQSLAETQWPVTRLKQAVRAVLGEGSKSFKIYVFVDALDECEVDLGANYLIHFLSDLSNASQRSNLRICFSCRDLPDVRIPNLSGSFKLQEKNQPDISSFICDQWTQARLDEDSGEEMNRLKSDLIEKADGIFLWARLALERVVTSILDGATIAELREIISDIPNQLEGIFAMLLKQIDARYINESNMMLSVVLTAARPLTLQEFRLIAALCGETQYRSQLDLDMSRNTVREGNMIARRIRSRCGGLLEVRTSPDVEAQMESLGVSNPSEGIIQFIHQSVKDFLSASSEDSKSRVYHPDKLTADGHALLAKACLQYLCLSEVREIPQRWSMGTNEPSILAELPFLRYAVRNWVFHCRSAEELGLPQAELIEDRLGRNDGVFECWRHILNCLLPNNMLREDCGLTELAVEHNLTSFVRGRCEKGDLDVNQWIRKHGSYLQLAVEHESKETAQVLLDHGAACGIRDSKSVPPLTLACVSGNSDLVEMLLNSGADLGETTTWEVGPDMWLDSVLVAVGFSGNIDIVRTVMNHDPAVMSTWWSRISIIWGLMTRFIEEVNSQQLDPRLWEFRQLQNNLLKVFQLVSTDMEVKTAAFGFKIQCSIWFLTGCSESTLKAIVEMDEGFSSIRYRNAYALELACSSGSLGSVRYLVENDTDLTHACLAGNAGTLLHSAVYNSSTSVLSYLLAKGLEVDALDNKGNTALHLAALSSGSSAYLELLLDNGADISIQDVQGYRPFHCALRNPKLRNHKNILRRLLGDPSKINLPINDGITPLHIAAATGYLTTVEWLLDNGADIHMRDEQCRTALHTAAGATGPDSPQTLNFLINHGLSPADRDDSDMTPLHHVLYSYDSLQIHAYDPDVSLANAKLLLRHGAEINAQDYNGNTPLHLAAWKGHISIVKLFLREGADITLRERRGLQSLDLAWLDEIRDLLEKA